MNGSHALLSRLYFFFFNDTATTEIYTLSLHDALPICLSLSRVKYLTGLGQIKARRLRENMITDRKSTRLNSSHGYISYAVFCLKKKKTSCTTCRRPQPPRPPARED